jgi:Rrf2 family iron-sulfur cluster assembly transcriptional regulator
MLLTRTSHYAISGVLRLATLPPEGFCRVEDLVKGTNAPPHAVAKVFHMLARRNILISVRGAGGGFRLSEKALDLTLMEVIEAVDGRFDPTATIERGLCLPNQACPLEQIISPIAARLAQALRSTRFRDLIGPCQSNECGCCTGHRRDVTGVATAPQSRIKPGGEES